MKKILLGFLLYIVCFSMASAQNKISTSGKGLVYDREKSMLAEVNTNGFRIGYSKGKLKSYYKTNITNFSLALIRHPKETKTQVVANSFAFGRSYVFGKQNSLFLLSYSKGKKVYLSEKDLVKGVAVGYSYTVGPQLGIIKPYYLNVFNGFENSDSGIRYSETTKDTFLDKDKIEGASPFAKGLRELSFAPSLHANVGLHFDWGAFENYVQAIEVGINTEIFLRKIPILVENSQNRSYFLNFYANLQFGKRK